MQKDAKPNPAVTNRDRIDTLKLHREASIGASSLSLIETVKAAKKSCLQALQGEQRHALCAADVLTFELFLLQKHTDGRG